MPPILVVDDDADIRQLVTELLRLSGYETAMASSGDEALELLEGGLVPSMVLLDVQMPGLDGWETLQAIRERPALAPLRVALCTVKSSARDTVHGWSLGCDGYVVKPFAIADLIEEIEAVLGADDAAREARRARALAVLADAD